MENTKKSTQYLTVLLIALAAIVVVMLYLYFDQKKNSERLIAQLEEYSGMVTAKKDSLERELKIIITQYDSLKTNNDTINFQLVEQQDKIRRLLSLRVSDAEKIKKYEKELGTIRDVLKSYIVQIDSLNTRNQLLTAENIQLRSFSSEVETKNKELEKEKEVLTQIKDEAKTLIASGIQAFPINNRGREQTKVKNVEKIRVDFTLRKNTLADPGAKMIYLQLLRPDGAVLGSGESGIIMVQDAEVAYSARREVVYENNDIPVSIYWDDNGDLLAGNYQVSLFCEGKKIGSSEFSLK
jgi:hypothetical protein